MPGERWALDMGPVGSVVPGTAWVVVGGGWASWRILVLSAEYASGSRFGELSVLASVSVEVVDRSFLPDVPEGVYTRFLMRVQRSSGGRLEYLGSVDFEVAGRIDLYDAHTLGHVYIRRSYRIQDATGRVVETSAYPASCPARGDLGGDCQSRWVLVGRCASWAGAFQSVMSAAFRALWNGPSVKAIQDPRPLRGPWLAHLPADAGHLLVLAARCAFFEEGYYEWLLAACDRAFHGKDPTGTVTNDPGQDKKP